MPRLRDPVQEGLHPIRDHRDRGEHIPDVDRRYCQYAYRMAGRSSVNIKPQPTEVADIQGAVFWDRAVRGGAAAGRGDRSTARGSDSRLLGGARPIGSWWWAGLAMGGSGGRGTLLPIKDRKFAADDRYAEFKVLKPGEKASPPVDPFVWDSQVRSATGGRIPGRLPGIIAAGSEEHSQEAIFLPSGGVLVAQHLGPHRSQMSSIIYDIDPDGRLHDDLNVGLQSAWRVKRLLEPGPGKPKPQPPWQEGKPGVPTGLCWNLAAAGDDSDGYGLCVGRPLQFAGGSVSVGPRQVIGYADALRGGPFTMGAAQDQHHAGVTKDGNPVGPVHLSAAALFYGGSSGREGPLAFQLAEWTEGSTGPYVQAVELRHHSAAPHPYFDARGQLRQGKGVWKWQTYTHWKKPTITPPITPPEPDPSGKGRKKKPPGKVTGGGEITGGGPRGVAKPPDNEGDTTPIRSQKNPYVAEADDTTPIRSQRNPYVVATSDDTTPIRSQRNPYVAEAESEEVGFGTFEWGKDYDPRTPKQKRADAEKQRKADKEAKGAKTAAGQTKEAVERREQERKEKREREEAERKEERDEKLKDEKKRRGIKDKPGAETGGSIEDDLRAGGLAGLGSGIMRAAPLSTPYEIGTSAIAIFASAAVSAATGYDTRYGFVENSRTSDNRRQGDVVDDRPVAVRMEGFGRTQDERKHDKNSDEVMGTRYEAGTVNTGGMLICPGELGIEDLTQGRTTARNLDEAAMSVPHIVLARTTRLSFAKDIDTASSGEPRSGYNVYRDPNDNMVAEAVDENGTKTVAQQWINNGDIVFPNNVQIDGKLIAAGGIDPPFMTFDAEKHYRHVPDERKQGGLYVHEDGSLRYVEHVRGDGTAREFRVALEPV